MSVAPPRSRTSLGAVTVVGAVLLAACSTGDGRTLRPPTEPPPTTTTTTVVSTSLDGDGAVSTGLPVDADLDTVPLGQGLELYGPWIEGGTIDPRFGCAGDGVSPMLTWSAVPAGTTEIAIVASDISGVDPQTAGPADDPLEVVAPIDPSLPVHWLVVGVAPGVTAIAEGGLPSGARALPNTFGVPDWTPPCPDEGTELDLRFTVVALGAPLPDLDGLPAESILDLLGPSALASANSVGTYRR